MKPDRETVLVNAYRRTLDMTDRDAVRVVADLAAHCHAMETTMPPAADALTLAFREGRRSVFLYIAGRLGLTMTPQQETDA